MDTRGKTHLQYAVILQDTEAIERLLHFGADPNVLDKDGRSPLHLLLSKPHHDLYDTPHIAKMLLEKGANPNAKMSVSETQDFSYSSVKGEYVTPLHLSVLRQQAEIVISLLKYGANQDAEGMCQLRSPDRADVELEQCTALHMASLMVHECTQHPCWNQQRSQNTKDIFRILLDSNIDSSLGSDQGLNALHILLSHNIKFSSQKEQRLWRQTILSIVEMLLKSDLDANVRDVWGRYPIEIAIVRMWPDAETLKQAHGRVVSGGMKGKSLLSLLLGSGVACKPLILFIEGADILKITPLKYVSDMMYDGRGRKFSKNKINVKYYEWTFPWPKFSVDSLSRRGDLLGNRDIADTAFDFNIIFNIELGIPHDFKRIEKDLNEHVRKYPFSPIVVVGFSYGGSVAHRVVTDVEQEFPGLSRLLVTLDPVNWFERGELKTQWVNIYTQNTDTWNDNVAKLGNRWQKQSSADVNLSTSIDHGDACKLFASIKEHVLEALDCPLEYKPLKLNASKASSKDLNDYCGR